MMRAEETDITVALLRLSDLGIGFLLVVGV